MTATCFCQSANNDWDHGNQTDRIEGSLTAGKTRESLPGRTTKNFLKLMPPGSDQNHPPERTQPGTIELLLEENDIARSVATFDLKEMIPVITPLPPAHKSRCPLNCPIIR